jgi:pentatricopeptide repeat protein
MKKFTTVFFTLCFSTVLISLIGLFTYKAGTGDCPQCGHTRTLISCNHCNWTACLECWQKMSKYNTCPNCERINP